MRRSILLSVEHLYKKYRNVNQYANYDVNLQVNRGEIVGLLGPNGAGKTTLVRQICGTVLPTKGKIFLQGQNIFENNSIVTQKISSLSQIMYAQRNLRVKEFIFYTGIYRGLTPKSAIQQTKSLLQYFHLYELKNRLIGTLSGGESRIVGFLGTVIGFRPFIVLDEPTNDMDPEHRILLWELIKQMREELGIAVLLVTHNVYEAQDVVNKVAIMQNGRILLCDTPECIINSVSTKKKIRFFVPYNVLIPEWLLNEKTFYQIDRENYEVSVPLSEVNCYISKILSSKFAKKIKNMQIISPSLAEAYLIKMNKQEGKNEYKEFI